MRVFKLITPLTTRSVREQLRKPATFEALVVQGREDVLLHAATMLKLLSVIQQITKQEPVYPVYTSLQPLKWLHHNIFQMCDLLINLSSLTFVESGKTPQGGLFKQTYWECMLL